MKLGIVNIIIISIFILKVISCNKGTDSITSPTEATITDIDGNVYRTIKIGNQEWMAENLKTTTLNDGTPIAHIKGSSKWSETTPPAYCWLNDDSLNKNTYGAFYNWYAVNTGKLAPTGWHVPSENDFLILINYLGGLNVAGPKLYELGFRAQGAGQLLDYDGIFNLSPDLDKYWTTTIGGWGPTDVKYLRLSRYDRIDQTTGWLGWSSHPKAAGHSVRCVKK